MPAAAVLRAKLLAGSDLKDPNSSVTKIIRESVQIALKQDGVTKAHFGTWIEDLSILQVIFAFTKSEIYPAFMQKVFSVTTGPQDAQVVHVDSKSLSGLEKALSAPLTSIATFAFEDGQAPLDYERNAQKFFDNITATGVRNDIIGDSFGLTLEEMEFGGVKGRCAVLIAGWSGREEYDRVHALPVFRENLKYLKHGVSHGETHYMQFTEVERS